MTTSILLTGSTGFVGRALSQDLLKSSLSLTTVLRTANPADKLNSFVVGDLDGRTDFSKALVNQDVVIHCAARVHIMQDSSVDPLAEFRAVNTEGTLNLARQAVEAGVKRFIFLSSIKVNGESTSQRAAFTAFDKALPVEPYAISKFEAEEQLLALAADSGMEVVIIRPPLVYGEGVKANFASLMKLMAKGLPLPFRAVNQNKRSLVSVYNLISLIKVCIDHPKAANQVFLASDDHDLSTSQMVALMAKVQGKVNLCFPMPVWCFKLAGKLFKKEAVLDRLVGSLELDIEHTKSTLNWTPPYSVEHGFTLATKN